MACGGKILRIARHLVDADHSQSDARRKSSWIYPPGHRRTVRCTMQWNADGKPRPGMIGWRLVILQQVVGGDPQIAKHDWVAAVAIVAWQRFRDILESLAEIAIHFGRSRQDVNRAVVSEFHARIEHPMRSGHHRLIQSDPRISLEKLCALTRTRRSTCPF